MEQYTQQEYKDLKQFYSCVVDVHNKFICYINEHITITKEYPRIEIDNKEYMVIKARGRKQDKDKRYYHDIIVVEINYDTDKKIYKNTDDKYYYSYEPQLDEYICTYNEIMWKYPSYYLEHLNDDINMPVLNIGMKVYNYSDYFNCIFLNTISKIEDGKIYFEENSKIYAKESRVFLTKQSAEECGKNTYDYEKKMYLHNNYWIDKLIYRIDDLKMPDKKIFIDILRNIDKDSIKILP